MMMVDKTQKCCCACGCGSEKQKEVKIEYLYLDLDTCDRCMGTDIVLEEVIDALKPAFDIAGYEISYNKI